MTTPRLEPPKIHEMQRRPSPAEQPHGLCCDGSALWISSRVTTHVYGISLGTWSVIEENAAPGMPWGMTAAGDDLYAVCGEPPDDNRFIRRYVKGSGFAAEPRKACPDDTGSYMAFDGSNLIVTQWYNRRVLYLNRALEVERSVRAQHEICGAAQANGSLYLVTTEDQETNDYWLSQVVGDGEDAHTVDIARIPFKARSLAWDGSQFWTNHRERDEIVAFAAPVDNVPMPR